MKYLALLRGINVGGNKKVPMADLKKQFKDQHFKQVSTLLNTGNVIFESDKNLASANSEIREILRSNYEFDIPFLVVMGEEVVQFSGRTNIQDCIADLAPEEKMIFTFVDDLSKVELDQLKACENMQVIDSSKNILCIKYSTKKSGTPEVMKSLDKILNKRGTSRNSNTISKIVERLKENI